MRCVWVRDNGLHVQNIRASIIRHSLSGHSNDPLPQLLREGTASITLKVAIFLTIQGSFTNLYRKWQISYLLFSGYRRKLRCILASRFYPMKKISMLFVTFKLPHNCRIVTKSANFWTDGDWWRIVDHLQQGQMEMLGWRRAVIRHKRSPNQDWPLKGFVACFEGYARNHPLWAAQIWPNSLFVC